MRSTDIRALTTSADGVAGVLVVVVVAAVASVWPARRATRVRPAIALRTE